MKRKTIQDSELQKLMKFISTMYSPEDIDSYLSLASSDSVYNQVEIKILSNSYAN